MVIIKEHEGAKKKSSTSQPLSAMSETPTVMRMRKYIGDLSEPSDEHDDSNREMLERKPSMRKYVAPKKKRDFCECMLTEKGLFQKVYSLDSKERLKVDESKPMDETFLIKGFGLKSLTSLQKFLASEKAFVDKLAEFSTVSTSVSSTTPEPETEASVSTVSAGPPPPMLPAQYLMPEEYPEPVYEIPYAQEEEMEFAAPSEEFWHPNTAVRGAQKYLRRHKIFEFIHYLTAMLVSAGPENPIEFLMVLLDKVLLYRAGLLSPPLLYDRLHIEQLFHLMDRFGQGYVTMEQYRTAMSTLGICQYKEHPMLNQYGMVSRETFIEEIFGAELSIFNDLIRDRATCVCARATAAPPPTIADLKAHTPSDVDDSRIVEFGHVTEAKRFYAKTGERALRAFADERARP